ncbi:MAG: stage V sporulation protein D [Firmicutes bacterium]|nr:stage V sporulation protein D [Bacillota bacterium]
MFIKDKQFRIKIVFIIVILVIVFMFLRILYIQVFSYDKLNDLATSLWQRNLPITADRGRILDRNGKVLATNITTTTLYVVPNQVIDKETTATKLASILGCDYDKMLKHLTKKTSLEKVNPEGRQLSSDIADKINELNIDGLYLMKESKRYYPYGTLLSHVLGYVGIDNQGLSGLELKYDDYLTGKNGSIKYTSDGKGNRLNNLEIYEEATNGMDIYLTIDIDIQLALEKELENSTAKYNPDESLAMVMDPNTGEIIAMGSNPTFDSNSYKEYSTEVINRNLPIWKNYEPGSTFKIITLAASIEEKTINVFEDHFHDGGSINVEGARIKCWKKGGHGSQTFMQVVQNSCNPGFVLMGQKLGTERLYSYVEKFGFTTKTGIDLNGESSGIMFDLQNIGPVEQATISFGQGISVTPIQQVTGVSAAINGGKLYKPYVVKYITEPVSNDIMYENSPTLVRRVISEDSSSLVRTVLESVVSTGTGKNAYIENYRVGGKTGTAQKVKDGKYMVGNYIVSFIGFLPADKPEYVVYVAIDYPKGVTQYGGTVSAPIAKNIMKNIISIKDIKPSKDVTPRTYTWLDVKYKQVPNVVGLSKKEVTKILKGFEVIYSGSGDTVMYQEPKEGTYIKENGTIRIMLK